MSGKLEKIALPDWAITFETMFGSQLNLALPTPKSMPATGSTETGSISDLPIFCSKANESLKNFMDISSCQVTASLVHWRAQRPHLSRRFKLESLLREAFACGRIKRANLRFNSRNRWHANAQLRNPQADEQRHCLRIAGDAATHTDPFAFCSCCAGGHRYQFKYRRTEPIDFRS